MIGLLGGSNICTRLLLCNVYSIYSDLIMVPRQTGQVTCAYPPSVVRNDFEGGTIS
jgi:hypothetical protein